MDKICLKNITFNPTIGDLPVLVNNGGDLNMLRHEKEWGKAMELNVVVLV